MGKKLWYETLHSLALSMPNEGGGRAVELLSIIDVPHSIHAHVQARGEGLGRVRCLAPEGQQVINYSFREPEMVLANTVVLGELQEDARIRWLLGRHFWSRGKKPARMQYVSAQLEAEMLGSTQAPVPRSDALGI